MNAVVDALNSFSIFGAHQAGAYREHAQKAVDELGEGFETRVQQYVAAWGASGKTGALVLTGNAGTGKTAIAESWSRAVGGELPEDDALELIADSRWAVKDFSGVLPRARPDVLELMGRLEAGDASGQLLLCANEGLLRTSLAAEHVEFLPILDEALSRGSAVSASGRVLILNMNRQRWTEPALWDRLVDYLVREDLWTECGSCSHHGACPIAANAAALRGAAPREALRRLVQLASGSTVATLRELLAILSNGITGALSCQDVESATDPFDAEYGYFNLILGGRLPAERIERSPLLQAMLEADVGQVPDLAVDAWLRDAGTAPEAVQAIAGADERDVHALLYSHRQGIISFSKLGEILTVSDDSEVVRDCLDDYARGKRFLGLWRKRVFFEAQAELGGYVAAFSRLTKFGFFGELLVLAQGLRDGAEPAEEKTRVVTGLNYLTSGFHTYFGRLVVPDPGSLASRNPGSYRLPDPSVVHSDIAVASLSLALEDTDALREFLDTDDVRVVLAVSSVAGHEARLLVTPRLYQAIRDSYDYRAPVGADIPEMAELAAFYARLADTPPPPVLRIVDPESGVIKEVTLPTLKVG